MMRMLRSIAVLLACLAIQHVFADRRACEESGYCSLGISKQWVGDIKDSQQLRAMLDTVSFRKEIILTIYMPQTDMPLLWLDPVHQYHHELMDMGFAHHLFVTLNEDHCKQMMLPGASCVWDSSHLPKPVMDGEQALWHSRWKLMARATRLGFNLLSTDTDFIFWRDPYVHLKSGQLASAQMMCMPEGGGIHNCNGGFLYVQNARPDGPVTWVFKHVIMSTLRRGDDDLAYISQFSRDKTYRTNCITFDQSLIMDGLVSAAVGRPMAYNGVLMCKPDATFPSQQGGNLTQPQVLDNIRYVWATGQRSKQQWLRPDAAWLRSLRLPELPWDDIMSMDGNLTVPNIDYGYPEELGGRMYPEAEGALSRAFTEQLQSDCPGCPWWPERRGMPASGDALQEVLAARAAAPTADLAQDKLGLFHDPNIATERLVQVPRWISSSLSITRRGTFTGRGAPVQGPFIMSHIHSWHLQTSRHHKIMLRKLFGRYNWSVGAATTSNTPYAMRRGVRRVLALSPNVDLSRTRSWEEMARIIAGLMQVAQLSRRTLVMPDLPCETAWLHDSYTRTEASENKKACIDYTFWRTVHRMPLPVTFPVDSKGALEGGWRRRLSAALSHLSGKRAATNATAMHATLVMAMTEDERHNAAKDGSHGMSGSKRRLLQQQSPAVEEGWWRQRRYMAAIPAFWDQTCTLDMRAITSPEFHYWLRTDESAATAQLQPGSANTVFQASRAEPRLQLVPPALPGGDAAAVPQGSLVQPSEAPGWSWADVQVALPVGQVLEELRSRADVPLLYVAHPLLVVGMGQQGEAGSDQAASQPGRRLSAQHQAGSAWQQDAQEFTPELLQKQWDVDEEDYECEREHDGAMRHLLATAAGDAMASEGAGPGKAVRRPNAILARINARLKSSACKALFVDPEKTEVVSLDAGLQGQLRSTRVALR